MAIKIRYFCYGTSGRMIANGDNMLMTEQKYITGFNDQKGEEVLIRADLLPAGDDFYVTLYKHHAGTHEFINITGYRVKQMIYQITSKLQFPKFKGSLGEMYIVPLGRDYFNGNALSFKLNANDDIASNSHIHYMLPGKIIIENEPSNYNMFFYNHRSSIVVTSTWKLFFIRCFRQLEKDVLALKCEKITSKDAAGYSSVDLGAGHNILNNFESEHMHYVVTNQGFIYRYNRKTKEITLASTFAKKKFIEVAFKEHANHLIIAGLSEDKKIYFQKVNLFNEFDSGQIIEPMEKYVDKKSSMESPGQFCPSSIDFSQTFAASLIVVNSCPPGKDEKLGKDRRLLTFAVTPTSVEILDKGKE